MRINETITIDDALIDERFFRAGGPGGQNVNKVSTAVELRFNVYRCTNLDARVRERIASLAGRRLTRDGILIIRAERFRTQEQNRTDAKARLRDLIQRALMRPKTRIPTRPSKGAKERRLKSKTHRSKVKTLRRSKPDLS